MPKKFYVIGGVVLVLVLLMMAVSYNNGFVSQEEGIIASHQDSKNVHASVFKNLKSQGVSVERYGDAVIEAIQAAMQGRYGGGSKAAFQWFKEHNPEISPDLYSKLQTSIEAGYNKFEAAQRNKIDRIRQYRSNLRSFPGSMVAGFMGFPKIDLKEYEQIVLTGATEKAFEEGKDEPINPFD